MGKITTILKGTQGVFLLIAKKAAVDSLPVPYVGIVHDKQNLRNDMLHFFSDFRNATDEAKGNMKIY
ncbi:MAG: hypothetical protein LBF81_01330 [Prevotellaceae bacterium]|jgi:hypothetical protein|nr:hypothetical protein [Prevotellaceae bacterium]